MLVDSNTGIEGSTLGEVLGFSPLCMFSDPLEFHSRLGKNQPQPSLSPAPSLPVLRSAAHFKEHTCYGHTSTHVQTLSQPPSAPLSLFRGSPFSRQSQGRSPPGSGRGTWAIGVENSGVPRTKEWPRMAGVTGSPRWAHHPFGSAHSLCQGQGTRQSRILWSVGPMAQTLVQV